MNFNEQSTPVVAQGELQLLNTNDGSKHIFKLIGKAKRALAQDHIVLKGQVKKR